MIPLTCLQRSRTPEILAAGVALSAFLVSAPVSGEETSGDFETLMSSGEIPQQDEPLTPARALDSLRTALLTSEFERRRLAGALEAMQVSLVELDREIAAENERLEPHRRSYSTDVAVLWQMTGVPAGAIIAMPGSSLVVHRSFVLANTLSANLDRRMKDMTSTVARLVALEETRAEEESLRRDTLALVFGIRGDIEIASERAREILAPLRVAREPVIETPATLEGFIRTLAGRPEPQFPKSDALTAEIRTALAVMSFEAWKGPMPLPAHGDVSGRERLHIATAPGETVVTPFDGMVVYAGKFTGYDNLLIVDHGGGYQSVLSGFAYDNVDPGQWLLAGQPVAVMASDTSVWQTLYVELRHEGVPINPLAWLTDGAGEVSDP